MNEKGLTESKSAWGAMLMALAAKFEELSGIAVPEATNGLNADTAVIFIGLALVIYGRVKASARITKL